MIKPKEKIEINKEKVAFKLKATLKEKIYEIFENILSISLLSNTKFLIFLINNILWNIGNLIFLVTLPEYHETIKLTDFQAAWVLSAIGICSTLGRFFMGLSAHFCKQHIWSYLLPNVLSGVLLLSYPFSPNYAMNVILSSGYGLLFGAQLGLIALLTAEEFGIEQMPAAYGYCMFADGIGALLGPPLSGLLFDATKQYSISFIVGGVVTIFAGLLIILFPVIDKLRDSFKTRAKDLILCETIK